MKYILTLTLFICFASYGQRKSDGMFMYNYIKSTKEKWEFFVLKDTIAGKIIYHAPAQAICGTFATASITIIETENGEKVRVLDLCNISEKYQIGQTIKVKPDVEGMENYSLPFKFVTNKNGKIEAESHYDLKVTETTWGSLID